MGSGSCANSAAAGQPLPVAQVLRWGKALAEALASAHAAGVVHRDVKPHSVGVRADGSAVLIDFGLARDFLEASVTLYEALGGSWASADPDWFWTNYWSGVGEEVPTDIAGFRLVAHRR